MRMAEIHQRFPALRRLHGRSRKAFEISIYRTSAPGVGSGFVVDYELWQLRVVALRVLLARAIRNAHVPTEVLRFAEWIDGVVLVRLGHDVDLHILVPQDVWNELVEA